MSRPYLSTALLAGLLTATQAFAQQEPRIDTVLATVGDTEITLGHAIALRATLPDDYDDVPAERLFDAVLRQLVQQTLVVEDTEGPLSTAARLRLENERRAITANDRLSQLTAGAVTDEAIRRAYEAEYGGGEGGGQTEYRASHILVETREEAERLAARLAEGENFAALAQEHSIGPSATSGGKLDWFGEGVMVPAFFEAVTALEEGEVSDPVETQFGWHLVKLDETRDKSAPELAAVRGELADQVRREAVRTYLDDRLETGAVGTSGAETVPPQAINRFDLLEN